jgi:autoinducer 2 (AI-2) kinase
MKALVTANFSAEGLALLRRRMDVAYAPWGETGELLTGEDLAERVTAEGIDVLIVEVDLVHEEVFDARKLIAVGCCRGDPLNVDVETATAMGVPVFFAPGRNAHAVADLTLGFMLALARGIVPVHNRLATGAFNPTDVKELMESLGAMSGFELGGATVGLVGLGAVGHQVARRLVPFGARILAYDPYAPDARLAEVGATRADLDDLLRASDVVSLHCAVTDQTRGMIDARRLALMKPTAYLVNTARYQLADGEALYAALKDRRIAGAALDVFKAEPPTPDDPFLKLDNVIVTPHIGGATREVVVHQSRMVAGDVERFLAGETPLHCANPEVLKK